MLIILASITAIMLVYLVAQIAIGPIGSRPAPAWFIAVLTGFFILITFNFRKVSIKLTDKKVKINYGIFSISRLWEDIAKCENDDKNYFYGWGIRFGRYKKRWVWVYNVIGGPRVVFLTRDNRPRSLIISTRNPEEIIKTAKDLIK